MIANAISMPGGATLKDAGSNAGEPLARIDQYELARELGGGGFGTVYLAKDTVSGVQYAVKGLPPFVKNNREELENIKANFALVSRLSHTNIARAHVLHLAKEVEYNSEDVHQRLRVDPGDTLMVMEYAPGTTLSQWRRQFPGRKVPLDKALEITRQIALALDYAHGQKILHRDVKPSNVMIETRPDGKLVARVLDFGLAAEIRSSMGRVSREIHDTSGTRPYMAPEQWLGGRQSPATDQYALAVLFHELVTGDVPFSSAFDTGDPVVMMNVVGREPAKLSENLPPCVRVALAKALAKLLEERFASCAEFIAALEGKVSCGGVEGKGGVSKVIVILAFLAALAGGAWWWTRGRNGKEGTNGANATATVQASGVQSPAPPTAPVPQAAPVPPAPIVPPAPVVPVGPTESDVAEIAVEATVQKARVERIDDADGFKERKILLSDSLTRATANRDERRWAEAARGFTNYVDGCKVLVALDAERKTAVSAGKKASAARKRAQDASAEKYAASRWNEAEKQMASATAAFGVMRFAEADKAFRLAQKQFNTSAGEANDERKRQEEQRKKNAESARSRASEASKEADAAGAKECAPDKWKAATESWDRGTKAWDTGDLATAITAYEEARRYYDACVQAAKSQAEKVKKAYDLFEKGQYKELMEIKGEDANLPDVAFLQGIVYEDGLLSVPDWKKACERYEVAVKCDHPLACAALGVLHSGKYDFLFGMKKQDKEHGLSLISKAKAKLHVMAEANNIYAQDLLGYLYWEGLGYEANRDVATEWYMKVKDRLLTGAAQGILDAQLGAGCRWSAGQWGETNYVEAVRWLRKAADQGSAVAQNLMGLAYKNGRGVEKNYDEAMKFYRKAADQGLAVAQNNIGVMYCDGSGVRQDYYEAVRWMRKAADQGNALAQVHMGRAYKEGWGVEKDYDEAMKWYRKAADQGLAVAQNNIGAMYWDGRGVRQDYYEAVRWMRKAADQGNALAQVHMGRAYNEGWGVEKDYDEAMKWYRKAADQGLAVAQNNIGIMYWNGEGVQQNRYEAVRWLRKAADNGCEDAKKTLKSLGYD